VNFSVCPNFFFYVVVGVQCLAFRLHSWCIGFPNSPAVVQAILSSVKLCLSLSEVDCFCALWNETLLHSFSCILYIQKVCISLNISFYPPYTFGGYVVVWLLTFCELFEPKRCFTLEMDFNVCVCVRERETFISPHYLWTSRLLYPVVVLPHPLTIMHQFVIQYLK
jgi:hypothetical protein